MSDLIEMLSNDSHTGADRATYLLLKASEDGLDLKDELANYIERHDKLDAIAGAIADAKFKSLRLEYFLSMEGTAYGSYGRTTRGADERLSLCLPDAQESLSPGDPVIIDEESGTIVDKAQFRPTTGSIGTIVSVCDGVTVVSLAGLEYVYRMAPNSDVRPGQKVVCDEQRKFIVQAAPHQDTQRTMFVPIEHIDAVASNYVDLHGACKELTFRAMSMSEHADWARRLGVRGTSSFMLCGPTGTGKSTAMKVVAKNLANYAEYKTGSRVSRLIVADASQFYSPYFGETEQKIKAWFESLKEIGSQKYLDDNGNDVSLPLVVCFEEAEALFANRGSSGVNNRLFDGPVALMLSLSSSVGSEINTQVMIVITSNRPHLLDTAAMRRFGMRKLYFGCLQMKQASQVIKARIENVELDSPQDVFCDQVVSHLYKCKQPAIATVKFKDGKSMHFYPRQLITPAVIEEFVSASVDETLHKAVEDEKFRPLSSQTVNAQADKYFASLQSTMTLDTLREFVPEAFDSREPVCEVM
jgi:SpoVK/Ycf46/Vps4 family AAA+-type ATPase